MIDAQPGVAAVGITKVVPEGINALARMQLAYRVLPTSRNESSECLADLGPEERIVEPSFRLIDVELSRHDVVIAGENNRFVRAKKCIRVLRQTLEPAELVIELRTGCRIAVGKIKAANQNAAYPRLNIAAVYVLRIAGEPA